MSESCERGEWGECFSRGGVPDMVICAASSPSISPNHLVEARATLGTLPPLPPLPPFWLEDAPVSPPGRTRAASLTVAPEHEDGWGQWLELPSKPYAWVEQTIPQAVMVAGLRAASQFKPRPQKETFP